LTAANCLVAICFEVNAKTMPRKNSALIYGAQFSIRSARLESFAIAVDWSTLAVINLPSQPWIPESKLPKL